MTEQIKELIDKINAEGVKAAENKAREIESRAREDAKAIINEAKTAAEKITAEAKERVAKMEENSRAALKQAGRDLLLMLRKEIHAVLDKIIALKTEEAMTPEQLAGIISLIAKECGEKKENLIVTLSPRDREALEKSFLSLIKEAISQGLTLKNNEDIRNGFTISYDRGKSHFDFSDQVLAGYIGRYLKPKLSEILKNV